MVLLDASNYLKNGRWSCQEIFVKIKWCIILISLTGLKSQLGSLITAQY